MQSVVQIINDFLIDILKNIDSCCDCEQKYQLFQ